jgi:hypothetical protein
MRAIALPILATLTLIGCNRGSATFGRSYDECVLKNAARGGDLANEICQRHFTREGTDREVANVSGDVKVIKSFDPAIEDAAHAAVDATVTAISNAERGVDELGLPLPPGIPAKAATPAAPPPAKDALEAQGRAYQAKIVAARRHGLSWVQIDGLQSKDWQTFSSAGLPEDQIARKMGYRDAATARYSFGLGVDELQINVTNNNTDVILKEIIVPVKFNTPKGLSELDWTYQVEIEPGASDVLTGTFDGTSAPSESFTARTLPHLVVPRTGKGG